jgi:hypothetical protein
MNASDYISFDNVPEFDALLRPCAIEDSELENVDESTQLYIYVHDVRLRRNVKRFPIKGKNLVSVGRGAKCDVFLTDHSISRVQLYFGLKNNICRFEDVGMNRIRVNEHHCSPRVRYHIEPPDTLSIGCYEIQVASSCFDDFTEEECDTLVPEHKKPIRGLVEASKISRGAATFRPRTASSRAS